MPAASTILMIRPAAFGFNAETAVNNYFQKDKPVDKKVIHQNALKEFDAMVTLLKESGVDVFVIDDTTEPVKPSAVFPNNWLSTSPDGKLFIYPMYAANRRTEKRDDILKLIAEKFKITDVQDWTELEAEGRFLEGTGSMVMDHDNKLIYASISERTNPAALEKFVTANDYSAVVFIAKDKDGNPVYHTNVVMTLSEKFCVLCEEAIEEEWELIAVKQLLESTEHEIIPITREQMYSFAGNMLEVKNSSGENILILSHAAFNILTREQKEKLESYDKLLPIAIPTIEAVEGGSVRCMMAEIFLPKK
ncbi:MAG: amidinotransferase [Bacteroidetes bacterium]|nr:MAG: amidinotransferase [Bacteroidota bacterium]